MNGKVVTFGEIMVRLMAPGYLKLMQATGFDANYTGAEANICVSLSLFGLETDFVTKLPDNEMTLITKAKMHQFKVGTDHISIGGDRMGLYYLERGASQRPSKVIYDRKYSSISMAEPSDFDWDQIFQGAAWFHFTGITAALGESLPAICEEACMAAQKRGVKISCDLNYRKNLWSEEKAQSVMTRLMQYVDVLIANEEDAEKCLGIKPENTDVLQGKLDKRGYEGLAKRLCELYDFEYIAFTLRTSLSASDNIWEGMLYHNQNTSFSRSYKIHMVDRVGGGDSFAAGLIYALYSEYEPQKAIDFAVAASCLKQTIEFDFNLSSVADVTALMNGDGSGRVQR